MTSLLSAVTGPIKRIPAMVNLAIEVHLETERSHEEAASTILQSRSISNNFGDYGAASAALMQQHEQEESMMNIGSAPFDFGTPPIQTRKFEQAVIAEKPVAPVLDRPVAPFDKSDRKKAYTNACYYAECFLKGISPRHADDAASTIQGRYTKWWLDSKPRPRTESLSKLSTSKALRGTKRKYISMKGKQGSPIHSRDQMILCDEENEVNNPSRKRRDLRSSFRQRLSKSSSSNKVSAIERVTAAGPSPLPMGCNDLPCGTVSTDDEEESAYIFETTSSNVQVDWDIPKYDKGSHSPILVPDAPRVDQNTLLSDHQLESIKAALITDLKQSGGCTDQASFKSRLQILKSHYECTEHDVRFDSTSTNNPFDIDGTWLTLSKPTFSECLGRNDHGDYIYTLGRMSFDMFRPTNLVCSIQGIYNTVHKQDHPFATANSANLDSKSSATIIPNYKYMAIPRRLRKEVQKHKDNGHLRSYNIVTAFTIEPTTSTNQSTPSTTIPIHRPIRAVMTTYGYYLPDPDTPNRLSIWFTGGSLEVNDEVHDLQEWKSIFRPDELPKRDVSEYAKLLAAKILLGARVPDQMEEDGTMSYILKRPIGGHGSAYCDVLFMDDTLRIMQGHHGTIYVFSRVPSPSTAQVSRGSQINKQTSLHNNNSKKKMVGARMA
mmetsp:Transcript_16678/g.25885  ORF Transcript_16678/g.25885 Transcript_16678/m.25885 type:complete len:662 (-) Transcript_16678:98-2083(-)|eukprot:CAMPEP_0195285994 /NCGR_PEP_ID=MMETSP0707-20130614/3621_1 /TAXON_ID=33640 /ORGANISM="Asterionellopsis glacialis, Strain CCMP134" /LENGTH=661 /DNA_ID=CAMNT_0040345577 /DNA_START=45 /DNA_END=2030 /DNA_ORIENTATION=-